MRLKLYIFVLINIVFFTGCASQTGWVPTIDPRRPQTNPYQRNYENRDQYDRFSNRPSGRRNRRNNQYAYNSECYGPNCFDNGNLHASYENDLAECRDLAAQSSGGTFRESATGALVGGLIGAAGGAAVGAVTGDPGSGAAIGAAVGGIGGAAKQGIDAEGQYKRAYSNCMRSRGHNVID